MLFRSGSCGIAVRPGQVAWGEPPNFAGNRRSLLGARNQAALAWLRAGCVQGSVPAAGAVCPAIVWPLGLHDGAPE